MTLEMIRDCAISINNRSKSLSWGTSIDNDVLVLVCGHPSHSTPVTYFIVTIDDSGIKCVCEGTCSKEKVVNSVQDIQDFIISVLKEVYS